MPTQKYTSLVNIIDSRPDLQAAIKKGLNINDWWNANGAKEYPGVDLVEPGDSLIQDPRTLTLEAQQGLPEVQTPFTPQKEQQSQYQTGNPELDGILGEFNKYIKGLETAGQRVNPNIELTPDQIKGFLDQASKEISPYYQSQLTSIKEDLSNNLKYLQQDYELNKQNKEAQFKQGLETTRENLAGAGLAFSGNRGAQEQGIQQSEQRELDLDALRLSQTAGEQSSQAAKLAGTRNLAGLNYPSVNAPTVNLSGAGSYDTGRNLSFAPTTSPVTCSLEREQLTATQTRASNLEEAERKSRALSLYY